MENRGKKEERQGAEEEGKKEEGTSPRGRRAQGKHQRRHSMWYDEGAKAKTSKPKKKIVKKRSRKEKPSIE